MNLTTEHMGTNSECQLFRDIEGTYLTNKIERSVYNRRRRRLFPYLEELRKMIADFINEFEDVFIIDSMPLKVCKNSRASRSRICKENHFSVPNKRYCASQKMYYYG